MAGLPPQEVKDLLHKLSTESTKVCAMFFNSASLVAVTLSGQLQITEDGKVAVCSGGDLNPFSPGLVEGLATLGPTLLEAPCEFLDPRDFANTPFAGFFTVTARFDFGMVFMLPGGSMLALLSIAS